MSAEELIEYRDRIIDKETNKLKSSFSDILKELLTEAKKVGISNAEFARRSLKYPSQIIKWLNGRTPSEQDIFLIASAIPSEFLYDKLIYAANPAKLLMDLGELPLENNDGINDILEEMDVPLLGNARNFE